MIEKEAARAKHPVSLAIVSRQIKARHLADAVGAARVKRSRLALRSLFNLAEHLARTGEVETARWAQFAQGCQHIMRAVDVRVHGGKAVGETFGDKALRCEVVAFVKINTADDAEDARIAFDAGRMERDSLQDVRDAGEPALRVFKRHSTHEPVHLVSLRQKIFGQIASVLTRNPCDERLSTHLASAFPFALCCSSRRTE